MSSDQVANQNIPFAPEVEEACLGAVLTNPNAYASVAQHISDEDFFLLRHQYIWQALTRITARGETFDYLTVGQELSDHGHLDDIGGIPYLMRLINNTPTSVHAEVYALLIRAAAVRRRLMQAGDAVKLLAQDERLPLDQVREQAQAAVQQAVGRSLHRRSYTMQDLLLDLLSEVEIRMEARANGAAMHGISSGYPSLDAITYGWLPGQLWYIAGRPGQGKTAMLVNLMVNAARQGKRVWAWLGEQSALEIMRRVMVREARTSGVQIRDFLNGSLTNAQYDALLNAVPALTPLPITIDDTPEITLAEMRAETLALKARGQLDLVIVDRLELMSVPGLDHQGKEVARVGALSTGLKGLARTLDVPVLCAMQLSRKVEERADKRPILSDLRDSGATEQDADGVLMLYRDAYYHEDTDYPNLLEAITRKHRDGPLGTAALYFDQPAMDIREAVFEQVDLSERVAFNGRAPLHHGTKDD